MAYVVIEQDKDGDVQQDAVRVFDARSLAVRYAVSRFYYDVVSQVEGSSLEDWSDEYQEFFELVGNLKYELAWSLMGRCLFDEVYSDDRRRIDIIDVGDVVGPGQFNAARLPYGIIDRKEALEWYEAFVEANKPEEEEEPEDEPEEDEDESDEDDDDDDDEKDSSSPKEDEALEEVQIILGGPRTGTEE